MSHQITLEELGLIPKTETPDQNKAIRKNYAFPCGGCICNHCANSVEVLKGVQRKGILIVLSVMNAGGVTGKSILTIGGTVAASIKLQMSMQIGFGKNLRL